MTAQLTKDVAASAMSLVVRRISVLTTTAVSTAVIARALQTSDYAALQTSLAVWTIALTLCEFGFGLMLSREFARRPDHASSLLRTARDLQGAIGLVVAAGFGVAAVVTGLDTTRGHIFLVLIPSLAVNGFSGGRNYFLATFQTRRLVRIDVTVAVAQVAAVTLAALYTHNAVAVAAITSAAVTANTVWVGAAARGAVGPSSSRPEMYAGILRQVVPIGVSSIISRVYVSIDLVILGVMASGTQVAYYAGAAKILAFLNTMTALIVAAALPGLSALREDTDAMLALMSRLFCWAAVTVIPAFVLCAVFAQVVCALMLGSSFASAGGLLALLAVTGIVSTMVQILSTVLTAVGTVKPILYQNIVAVTVNVAGNVLLIPHYGAWACAALTLLTECVVCGGSLWSLSRRYRLATPFTVVLRPLVATALAAAAAIPLQDRPWIGLPIGAAVLLVTIRALNCWPAEFPLQRFLGRTPDRPAAAN